MDQALISNQIAAGITGVTGIGGMSAKKKWVAPGQKSKQALLTKISQKIGGPGLKYTSAASKFCGGAFLALGVADAGVEVYCAGKCALE